MLIAFVCARKVRADGRREGGEAKKKGNKNKFASSVGAVVVVVAHCNNHRGAKVTLPLLHPLRPSYQCASFHPSSRMGPMRRAGTPFLRFEFLGSGKQRRRARAETTSLGTLPRLVGGSSPSIQSKFLVPIETSQRDASIGSNKNKEKGGEQPV